MKHSFKVGGYIWHGSRYWKTDGLVGAERIGWNTTFIAYQIIKITAKQIVASCPTCRLFPCITLKRLVMERDGKQYHTGPHEYFYADKPKTDPEHRYYDQHIPSFHQVFGNSEYLTTLGLNQPYTRRDALSAYRRLAKIAHPDKGGSSQEFTRLKSAYDTALKFAEH